MTGLSAAVLLIALAQTPAPADQGPVIPKAPDAETVLAQAVKLHEAGDIIGAITNYEAYLKTDPNDVTDDEWRNSGGLDRRCRRVFAAEAADFIEEIAQICLWLLVHKLSYSTLFESGHSQKQLRLT